MPGRLLIRRDSLQLQLLLLPSGTASLHITSRYTLLPRLLGCPGLVALLDTPRSRRQVRVIQRGQLLVGGRLPMLALPWCDV